MKTKISIFAIIVAAILAIAAIPFPELSKPEKSVKQTTDGFSFIRTHRQGKGATTTWAFVSDNVSGFTVQRTYEDPSDPYAFWEAVCNTNCNSSRSYKYTDENLLPGFINYRVVALMNDGSTICSDLSSIRIQSR